MLDNVFQVVYLVAWVLIVVVRIVSVSLYANDKTRDRSRCMGAEECVLLALAFLGNTLLPLVWIFTDWLTYAAYPFPDVLRYIGLAPLIVGGWLMWRAHADLGRNWSATVEPMDEHELITDGVYRRIRHPIYAAHLLWGIGQWLIISNWVAGPANLIATLLLYATRAPREEKLLSDQFGEAYATYMKQTGRIIPKC